jgi:hypothetical protein
MKQLVIGMVFALTTFPAPLARAQDSDDDKATGAAIKQASEAAKKMGMDMPDVKKMMEESDQEEAKEKAARQAVVDAPGPAVLPAWTPKTPQFAPAGPVAKKLVEDEPVIAQSGTSTLGPEELAEAWEKAVASQEINHVRNTITVNGTLTTIVFLSSRTPPEEEVRLEARREPGEKVSQVMITSPLPVPETAEAEED